MIAFIDDHRQAYGVEPICRVLPIAPSTYHAHAAWRADPSRLPKRVRRDADLKVEIRRVFEENFRVYGVRKVWRQLRREGFSVARCTVARLMWDMGLQGAIRGKPLRTTISDKAAPCPLDHVNRQFHAPAPDRLWLADFTYVANVYDKEPLPHDHLLRASGNTVLTPHIGCGVEETWRDFYPLSIENALAFLDGAPIRGLNDSVRG